MFYGTEAERLEMEQKAAIRRLADVKAANQVRPDKIRRYLKVGLIHAIKMIRSDSSCSLKVAKLRAEHVRDTPLRKLLVSVKVRSFSEGERK